MKFDNFILFKESIFNSWRLKIKNFIDYNVINH